MSKWFLSAALVLTMACPPPDKQFAGGGSSLDDTGPSEDTGEIVTSDCPPALGDPTAAIDDYPGKGWVIEVTLPFEQGTCEITEGDLYLELDDGAGGTNIEGPFSIGFEAEDVYVDDWNEDEGAGELFFAFTVDSASSTVDFSLWVEFGDGSSTPHLAVSVN